MLNTDSTSNCQSDLTSLADAAVRSQGSAASNSVARLRAAYPNLDRPQLAALVAWQFSELAEGVGAAAGLPSEPVADEHGRTATGGPSQLTRLQLRMLLEIAAVFGYDPEDPGRAMELVGLCGIYGQADPARVAMTRTSQRILAWLIDHPGTFAAMGLQRRHREVALKLASYVGVPVGAATFRAATMTVARRAMDYYDPNEAAWNRATSSSASRGLDKREGQSELPAARSDVLANGSPTPNAQAARLRDPSLSVVPQSGHDTDRGAPITP
jgi:hypothetical protein